MGKLFRQADAEATETYYFGEEGEEDRDWVRVRASITNAEAHQLLAKAPTGERDLEGGFQFIERVFDHVVVAWSLVDRQGEPLAPTVENLRTMDAAGARQLEDRVAQHLSRLLGREVEKTEGESSS